MAKLYWRIKKNGKWTWRKAAVADEIDLDDLFDYYFVRKEDVNHES